MTTALADALKRAGLTLEDNRRNPRAANELLQRAGTISELRLVQRDLSAMINHLEAAYVASRKGDDMARDKADFTANRLFDAIDERLTKISEASEERSNG